MQTVKRIAVLLLVMLLAAACSQPPQEAKSRSGAYTNPVYVGKSDGLPEAADPGPLKYNGEYYAYMTGDPCQVLKSDDLVSWKLLGPIYPEKENCWAPDLTYRNGKFYAYLSTVRPDMGEQSRRVRLYTADRPEGPFTYVADLTKYYSYDAHYFQDEDGQAYLYWTQECVTLRGVDPCSGNAVVVDRLTSMSTLAGETTRVAVALIGEWECQSRCILEAPQVVKRDGRFYLQYSGAAYETSSYSGGSAVSAVPMGPGGEQDQSWVKGPQVLASVEAKVDGPGGASWVKGPTNLEDWTIYHARGVSRETWDRWPRIDPVMWGRDRFWIPGGASYEPQPGPALPAFRDLFNRPDGDGLGKEWTVTGGTWLVKGGAARQTDGGAAAVRALEPKAAEHYVFEANLRWLPESTGGAVGVYAYYADEKNYVNALLDRVSRTLAVTPVVDGAPGEVKRFGLAEGLDFAAYHQLIVRKNGDRFTFAVDGLPVGEVAVGFGAPGRAGLATNGAAAEFDGIAFAEGWEDFFEGQGLTWGAPKAGEMAGQWAVQASVLAQRSTQGEARVFKGSREWGSYELTASLRRTGGSGEVGLYAAYYDPKNYVAVVLKPDGLETRAVLNGKPAESQASPLKAFDPGVWHTVRVTKNGFAFRIYVDGQLVQERTLSLTRGQPGLLTREAAAEYDSIRAVRWD